MSYSLLPWIKSRFTDNNGRPLAFGSVGTYKAGTNTKANTAKSFNGGLNKNPVKLDVRGEADIWLEDGVAYKIVLYKGSTASTEAEIYTVDNVIGSAAGGGVSTSGTVKVSAGDPIASYLINKLAAGANIELTEVLSALGNTVRITAINDKVKASSSDSTPGFLNTKIVAQDSTIKVTNNGGTIGLAVDINEIPPGPQGPQGIQGPQGVKGDKGDTGADGTFEGAISPFKVEGYTSVPSLTIVTATLGTIEYDPENVVADNAFTAPTNGTYRFVGVLDVGSGSLGIEGRYRYGLAYYKRESGSATYVFQETIGFMDITGRTALLIEGSNVVTGSFDLQLNAGDSIQLRITGDANADTVIVHTTFLGSAIESITIMQNGGSAAGNDTEVQFNDGGILGASPNFTFDKTLGNLDVSGFMRPAAGVSTPLVRVEDSFIAALNASITKDGINVTTGGGSIQVLNYGDGQSIQGDTSDDDHTAYVGMYSSSSGTVIRGTHNNLNDPTQDSYARIDIDDNRSAITLGSEGSFISLGTFNGVETLFMGNVLLTSDDNAELLNGVVVGEAVTARDGSIQYKDDKFQFYQDGVWVDLGSSYQNEFPEQELLQGGGYKYANCTIGQAWYYVAADTSPLGISILNSKTGFHYTFRLDFTSAIPSTVGWPGAAEWLETEPTWEAKEYLIRMYRSDDHVMYLYNVAGGTGGGTIDYTKFPYIPQATPPTVTEGGTYYDANRHNIVVKNSTNVLMDVGRENWIRYKNETGSTITAGQALYVEGGAVEGSENVASCALALSTSKNTLKSLCVAAEDVLAGEYGEAETFGLVRDIDTSLYPAGSILYVSAVTPGALSLAEPAFPNFSAKVGVVINQHATDGAIQIQSDTDPQYGGGVAPALGGGVYDIVLTDSTQSLSLSDPNGGYWSTLFIPSNPITISSISIFVTQVGINYGLRAGVYSHDSTDVKLAESGFFTGALTLGINTFALLTPIVVAANTAVMIALQASCNGTMIAQRNLGLNPNVPNHFSRADYWNAGKPTSGMIDTCSYSTTTDKIWFGLT